MAMQLSHMLITFDIIACESFTAIPLECTHAVTFALCLQQTAILVSGIVRRLRVFQMGKF